MTDSTCTTTFFADKYNCYTKSKNTNEDKLVQFFIISCKKQFYEFTLAFLFSHGKHMLWTNVYTDMHAYILPSIYSPIRTYIFCSFTEPHFLTSDTQLIIYLVYMRIRTVSSRASYGVTLTILLSQHLLVGHRAPSGGCKQIGFFSMNWNHRKCLESTTKDKKTTKKHKRKAGGKKVKMELSQFMSSHCQVGTFSRTSQLSYLT